MSLPTKVNSQTSNITSDINNNQCYIIFLTMILLSETYKKNND